MRSKKEGDKKDPVLVTRYRRRYPEVRTSDMDAACARNLQPSTTLSDRNWHTQDFKRSCSRSGSASAAAGPAEEELQSTPASSSRSLFSLGRSRNGGGSKSKTSSVSAPGRRNEMVSIAKTNSGAAGTGDAHQRQEQGFLATRTYRKGRWVFDGVISMRAKHLAHGSDTLVISAVLWAEFPDANFSDIRTTLPASQCLLPPENPDELIETGARMALLEGLRPEEEKAILSHVPRAPVGISVRISVGPTGGRNDGTRVRTEGGGDRNAARTAGLAPLICR